MSDLLFFNHQLSLHLAAFTLSVRRGRRGYPRRDGGGRRRPQLLDGVEVVLVALAVLFVEIVLEELVHRPGDGRRRGLVQHPRTQALRDLSINFCWVRFAYIT